MEEKTGSWCKISTLLVLRFFSSSHKLFNQRLLQAISIKMRIRNVQKTRGLMNIAQIPVSQHGLFLYRS